MLLVIIYLLFTNMYAVANFPRIMFTHKETTVKRSPLPVPVQTIVVGGPDSVITAGQEKLISFNFGNEKNPVETVPSWKECRGGQLPQRDCNHNITVFHKRKEGNQVFVCGTNRKETLCCDMNLSEESPMCIPSPKTESISQSIQDFTLKEGEPSALVESDGSEDLYVTFSGSQDLVGIYKFGGNKVRPAMHNKEQHYVGLVESRREDDPLQNRVYAFYNEKNTDTDLDNRMWAPFVSQVCMADIGGPKNTMELMWTSEMNARLFCGNPDSRRHFSVLVDMVTVRAEHWHDTRIYTLFRNEWGMSAVCVYAIGDIQRIFANSPFKGETRTKSRECVPDSKKIPLDTLMMRFSEMEQWIQPVSDFSPLVFEHNSYTHISVDSFMHKRNNHHPVLFLSLDNGGIHKVMNDNGEAFVISEYRPFKRGTYILSIALHPSSRKLYVNSRKELVQLDVTNCTQYGDSCQECVLARDPYCGWNGTHCTPETSGTVQDVAGGNHSICESKLLPAEDGNVHSIELPVHSKYILQCLISSHHAHYMWDHHGNSTPCNSREQQCQLLIDSMGPAQVGSYKCVSKEQGYSRVRAEYKLQLGTEAVGHSSALVVCVGLVAIVFGVLCTILIKKMQGSCVKHKHKHTAIDL